LIVPTIDGCSVQWNPSGALLDTVIERVVAPGLTLPTSVPLSRTMWCKVESLFLQTTALPAAAATGFGVKAELPTDPTIATVTCDDGAGLGAGAGAGAAVTAGDGLGLGVADGDGELGDEYPPHAVATRATTAMMEVSNGNRTMTTSWIEMERRHLRRCDPAVASTAPRVRLRESGASGRECCCSLTTPETNYAVSGPRRAISLYH
jgi:hypothetical protein